MSRPGTLVAKNTFTKGLRRDELPFIANEATYRLALNAINASSENKGFGLVNEGSNRHCASDSSIVGEHYLEERNQSLLLKSGDEFWLFDHEKETEHFIFSGGEFGCNFGLGNCEWHDIESATKKACNETYIYFSSQCEYYWFNLDEMLDKPRKEGLKERIECEGTCVAGCDFFKVFQPACATKINAKTSSSGGGQLSAGAYQFTSRLINQDGGHTNWFHFSDPVYVGSEHNIAGEPGNGHIEIQFSCLDCRFNKIEIAVVESIGGVITTKSLGVKNYNDNKLSYNYYGNEGVVIANEEVLLKGETYLQGKYIEQRDSRNYYYGIRERRNVNYQRYANQIQTSWVVYQMPYEYAKKNDIKSLMRGETYGFDITLNHIDGTHTYGFHIPAVNGSGGSPGDGVVGEGSGSYDPGVGGPRSSSGGGADGATGGASASASTNLQEKCRYEDDPNDNTAVIYDAAANQLQIFIAGLVSTDLIECIVECIRESGLALIKIEDQDGEKTDFTAVRVLSVTSEYIKLSGSSTNIYKGQAEEVVVLCGQSSSGGGGGGGGGGLGGGGGGQSQASMPTVTIEQPQCVIRKREHKREDDVSNPQHDDYDDELQKEIDEHDTVDPDLTEETRLHEDMVQSHCCWCDAGGSEDCLEFCGDPNNNTGSFSFTQSAFIPSIDPDTGEVEVSGDGETVYVDSGTGQKGVSYEGSLGTLHAVNSSLAKLFDVDDLPILVKPTTTGTGGGGCCGGGPCKEGTSTERSRDDHPNVDEAASDWVAMLSSYLKDELDAKPDMDSVDEIKEAAQLLMKRIQERERRWDVKRRKYNVSKSVSYESSTAFLKKNIEKNAIGSNIADCSGAPESEVEITIIASGRTTPKEEKDILYPCTTDCDGNPLYGSLAGTNVTHHTFPNASEQPHYVSKSMGVPYSEISPDADEYADGYVNIMGVRFDNIQLPSEDELSVPLCKTNPYTIGMIKRTERNKTVILKGLATGTFKISNHGKDYDQPRYGVNSREEVSRYHDEGGSRLSNGGHGDSFNIWSLDGAVRKPALNADFVRNELTLDGIGFRYGLYAKGKEPEGLDASRIDNLGARSSINLHMRTPAGGEDLPLDFKIYAPSDSAVAPPAGGTTPLQNRYGQENIWIGAGLPQHKDDSFLGDVLEHSAPADNARGNYVALTRELDNQYGSLENISYIPILQAGKRELFEGSIEGPVGDVYIGPYSFVKTGYVSDKVGSCETSGQKFNIPAQVDTKRERRCICDGPEDIIDQYHGLWVWTDLPEDGDAADPKNWAGTHTHDLNHTDLHSEAVGEDAVSDFYYPRTTTVNITYWGEHEVCPWRRELSEVLEDQWYPEIKTPQFRLDSGVSIDGQGTWEDAYLNQFYAEQRQPSMWRRAAKALIRALINIIFPIWGLDNTFDVTTGMNLVGNLLEYPFMVTLWYLMNQVLYKNEKLDKFLQIPICKSDNVSSDSDAMIKGFFENPINYNWDYSTQNDIYVYPGMPDNYYTCDCDKCADKGEYSNAIYYSDQQKTNSNYDAYRHVKPLNFLNLPAHTGKLTNLFSRGPAFYAHTTDAIWQIRYGTDELPSDIASIILGTGDLFGKPNTFTQGIIEGFAGLQYHNAAINTQYGYFFVDADANKIYKFVDGLEEISNRGMFNFFKERLGFCDPTKCRDQRVEGTSYYALGIDPRYNRFLVTKSEADEEKSFTLSYDLDKDTWISFHSYIPKHYIFSRKDIYSVKNGIWVHNEDCDFQTYYGEYHPHIIEFTAVPKINQQPLKAFTYQSSTIRTEAEKCVTENCSYAKDLDYTFNKLAAYNTTQSTGTVKLRRIGDDYGQGEDAHELIVEKAKAIKIQKNHREWDFNEIQDFRSQNCKDVPMTTCDVCEPYPKINEFGCSPDNAQQYKGKVMEDDHLTYRFILDDGDSKKRLKTIYVETYTSEDINNLNP